MEGDCISTLLKQDGQFSVLFTKCDSSPGRVDYSYYCYPVERVRKGPELVLTEADLATFIGDEKGKPNFLSLGFQNCFLRTVQLRG